jgi:hypothetical protein
MTTTDVCWMVGNTGSWDNWELRLSMRSFAQHYQCPDALFTLIGRIPHWIDREMVRCLEFSDPFSHNKDANLIRKATRLAAERGISDQFILCSDDHLLLKPSGPADFKYWHCGELPNLCSEGNAYTTRLFMTRLMLERAGLPTWHFEGHVPYVLHKDWLGEALYHLPWSTHECTLFSTILNNALARENLDPTPISGERVRGWLGAGLPMDALRRKLRSNRFATLDNSLCNADGSPGNPELCRMLEELFPVPGYWEKDANL